MKVIINGTEEILDVSVVTEKLRNDGSFALEITVNDSAEPLDKLNSAFKDVTEVKVIREDLNGEEQTAVFTSYTTVEKIQRRVVDETDTTTVSLVRAALTNTEDGEGNT